MAESKRAGVKPNVLSESYRRIPIDTFSLRISNNGAQLTLSLETTDTNDAEVIVREVTAIMTHQSLKVLQIALTSTLAAVEKQFGPVVLAPGKEDELRKLTTIFQPPKKHPDSSGQ